MVEKKRKDVKTTTADGRIILRRHYGVSEEKLREAFPEIPKDVPIKRTDNPVQLEPRSAKAYPELWQFVRTIKKPEEIEYLITKRRKEIAWTKNKAEIKKLRGEILLLEDAHKILRLKRGN